MASYKIRVCNVRTFTIGKVRTEVTVYNRQVRSENVVSELQLASTFIVHLPVRQYTQNIVSRSLVAIVNMWK